MEQLRNELLKGLKTTASDILDSIESLDENIKEPVNGFRDIQLRDENTQLAMDELEENIQLIQTLFESIEIVHGYAERHKVG